MQRSPWISSITFNDTFFYKNKPLLYLPKVLWYDKKAVQRRRLPRLTGSKQFRGMNQQATIKTECGEWNSGSVIRSHSPSVFHGCLTGAGLEKGGTRLLKRCTALSSYQTPDQKQRRWQERLRD